MKCFARRGARHPQPDTRAPGERHLTPLPSERVLREYARHHNKESPHRGLALETPEPKPLPSSADGEIVRVARLGGLINEYHRIAA